uniref:Uncharacterized protein n=1 Tax=Amphiprion percula TaxID=161767 RepID=A0A3P8S1J6_AMPPE
MDRDEDRWKLHQNGILGRRREERGGFRLDLFPPGCRSWSPEAPPAASAASLLFFIRGSWRDSDHFLSCRVNLCSLGVSVSLLPPSMFNAVHELCIYCVCRPAVPPGADYPAAPANIPHLRGQTWLFVDAETTVRSCSRPDWTLWRTDRIGSSGGPLLDLLEDRTAPSGGPLLDLLEDRIGPSGGPLLDLLEDWIGPSGGPLLDLVEDWIGPSGGPLLDLLEDRIGPSGGPLLDLLEDQIGPSGGPLLDLLEDRIGSSGGPLLDLLEDRTAPSGGPLLDLLEDRIGPSGGPLLDLLEDWIGPSGGPLLDLRTGLDLLEDRFWTF